VRSSASAFNFQYTLFFLGSSCRFLRLLRWLPVILPSVFPLVTCVSRQLLHKMSPIQLALLVLVVCRMFLSSLTLCNTSFLTRSVQLISGSPPPAPHFTTSQVFLIYFPKCPTFSTTQSYVLYWLLPLLYVQFAGEKKVFFLLNAWQSMTILELISRVHPASCVTVLPKYFRYFTFSGCF